MDWQINLLARLSMQTVFTAFTGSRLG